MSTRRSRVFTTNPTHPYDFAFPKRSWTKALYSTFAVAIINVTFYYIATLATVYAEASSARRVVCIIRVILALYSQNTSESISECLKFKFSWGACLPQNHMQARYARINALCVLLEPPPLRISVYAHAMAMLYVTH